VLFRIHTSSFQYVSQIERKNAYPSLEGGGPAARFHVPQPIIEGRGTYLVDLVIDVVLTRKEM
jgi:hypothetical protein